MGERMEVEVVCPGCEGTEMVDLCRVCWGKAFVTASAVEGSLTAARLRLADAAEAVLDAEYRRRQEGNAGSAWTDLVDALCTIEEQAAALRTKRAGG